LLPEVISDAKVLVVHAIEYLRCITAINSEQPFFIYYVPGAMHAPHDPIERRQRRPGIRLNTSR